MHFCYWLVCSLFEPACWHRAVSATSSIEQLIRKILLPFCRLFNLVATSLVATALVATALVAIALVATALLLRNNQCNKSAGPTSQCSKFKQAVNLAMHFGDAASALALQAGSVSFTLQSEFRISVAGNGLRGMLHTDPSL